MIAWHTLFLASIALIVAQGVSGGIERAVRWLMPLFAILLIGLAVYAGLVGDFATGAAFLFKPDFAALTPAATLSAAGHAFFTLSLGMGAMIAYGGYLARDVPISKTAIWVAGADTICSLAAGLAIFPIVFGFGLDPAEGPGLVFIALPVAFAGMPCGGLVASAFFLLLVIAAVASAVSALEPLVAASGAIEPRPGRRQRTWVLAGAVWAFGLVSVLSFNLWAQLRVPGLDLGLFDALNFLSAEIALPVVGVGVAVFVGWRIPDLLTREGFGSGARRAIWLVVLRFVSPLIVGLVPADALI